MLTATVFIIVLSILIFVHELGHFLTAKKAGMKVEEFGFGFPPRAWGIKRGETIYSVNWIPFGGFVKILGEDGEHKDNHRSFAHAKPGIKSLVLVAGVTMNLLLAVALLSVGNYIGLRIGLSDSDLNGRVKDLKIQIVQIADNSPAQKAGLLALDEIKGIKIGNTPEYFVQKVADVQNIVNANKGNRVILDIRRGSQEVDKEIIPRINPPAGEGALGISLAATGIVNYPWYQAIYRGVQDTYFIARDTLFGYGLIIKNLFSTGKPGVELTGPVGIAVVTGQAARLGFAYLIQFMSLISINLAILNILPFPALDGGRLLFVIIEKIRRKPVSKKIENAVNAFGFALLLILMVYVTTKDVIKFF